jgi:1-deoxy-D-xylulose-5-phosphate synthase
MASMLERVGSPTQLKGLSYQELVQLSVDIRAELIESVAQTGGHLASNLGVVELTIALHRVFDSPRDKIVWDVGHQAYVHKLLTGRRDRFGSLRQYGGLSGFTDRAESPHDPFGAGHASTALSAALGMALARDLVGESNHVLAVIGDGSFGGGMAFEALNHAGHLGTRLIVVLNDNGMSISPSVGALSKALNTIRLDGKYEMAKAETKRAMIHLPMGRPLYTAGKRFKNGLKRALIPTSIWEGLGFVYIGPVDGHDIREVEAALKRARDHETRPTLVHVLTKKGKGHQPAEADATRYHGLSPHGSKTSSAPSYSEVFGRTIYRLMREDNRIVAITAAMLDGTGLALAASKFPHRVFDVGICEQHAVTMAAGLATQGIRPVFAVYSTFLQRAYDQIVHDVCIPRLPVLFAVDRAGIVGDDGKTHHGAFDISFLCGIPNMVVSAPKDEDELRRLLYTAVASELPMAIRYPRDRGRGVEMNQELCALPVGRGELLREGCDVGVLALGSTVYPALEAAERLAREGIECSVVNARFAKPLDAELILSVARRTGRILTAEEGVISGGFGAAVMRLLGESGLPEVRVECLGLPDRFVEHGPRGMFLKMFDLDAEGIARWVGDAFPELRHRPTIQFVVGGER